MKEKRIIADLYDFDKTVYYSDSSIRFWLFCLKKRPWIILYLPRQLFGGFLFWFDIGNSARAKSLLTCFLKAVPWKEMVEEFWKENEKNIFPFFRPENRDRPAVVCSASLDFWMIPICKKMKVEKLVCTVYDTGTHTITSPNCNGKEKLRRLVKECRDYKFINAYTDSERKDKYMASLAEHAYLVKDGKIVRQIK